MTNLDLELNLGLYKKLYLIRRAETEIRIHYHKDEMKTPVHLSIGEEAIAVGVCCALGRDDQILGTYRSHGIYLARTGETDSFFAELYGKDTGLARGKAGSMHLAAPEMGFIGTSAIVGSMIPVAVGAAFANKYKKNGKIVVVFFGDGTIGEGVFWESINIACLMKLPVLFICEDNGLAVHSPSANRQGFHSITQIVSEFNCNVLKEETTDVEAIYKLTCKAIKLIRDAQKPSFLHLKYYRYLEHVGVNEDFDAGYRSKDEFLIWLKKDPIELQRTKLINAGYAEEKIKKLELEIENQIISSRIKAEKAPFPQKDELYNGVFT